MHVAQLRRKLGDAGGDPHRPRRRVQAAVDVRPLPQPARAAVRGDRGDRRALGRDHARPRPRAHAPRGRGRDAEGPRPPGGADRRRGAERALAAHPPAAAAPVPRSASTSATCSTRRCCRSGARRRARGRHGRRPAASRSTGPHYYFAAEPVGQARLHPAASEEPDQHALDAVRRGDRDRRARRRRCSPRPPPGSSRGGSSRPVARVAAARRSLAGGRASGAGARGGRRRAGDARGRLQRPRRAARAAPGRRSARSCSRSATS